MNDAQKLTIDCDKLVRSAREKGLVCLVINVGHLGTICTHAPADLPSPDVSHMLIEGLAANLRGTKGAKREEAILRTVEVLRQSLKTLDSRRKGGLV